MASRDNILENLRNNKPELIELPQFNWSIFDEHLDIVNEFTKKVEVVGGQVSRINNDSEVLEFISKSFTDTQVNFSTLETNTSFNTIDLEKLQKPQELEDLDVLVLESSLGVAENGSIWLSDSNIPVRVLPFITKHLVIVLSKENLVSYMHEGYEKINKMPTEDYGVFISGPSKTADIEQSLVIGAHGALSLTVLLKD